MIVVNEGRHFAAQKLLLQGSEGCFGRPPSRPPSPPPVQPPPPPPPSPSPPPPPPPSNVRARLKFFRHKICVPVSSSHHKLLELSVVPFPHPNHLRNPRHSSRLSIQLLNFRCGSFVLSLTLIYCRDVVRQLRLSQKGIAAR